MDQAPGATRAVGWSRLATGAVQGVLLWLVARQDDHLNGGWLSHQPILFGAAILTIAFTPVVVLAGLGQMRRWTLALLTVVTALALFGIGAYDQWRIEGEPGHLWPTPHVYLMAAAALFIAHHLVAASDEHRRWRAPYPAYFDIAWKHGVQLGLAVAFTGAFWLLLLLGSALFAAIGLGGFRAFIMHDWFRIIATAIMFAGAVHLTDVRSGLVQGIRTVALTLLSWLMPLMAAIALAFLPSLLFTGLKPLAGTGGAGELLLGSAAALIILINAAYQDGETDTPIPAAIRWGGRGAAVMLVPIIALAAYALALRIGEHGLSPERIMACACVVVGASYAAGYALAALRRTAWMKGIETTNIVTGHLALAMLLLLLSPVLDPARIAAANQVGRLHNGKIEAAKFDYRFLRFDSARFGREALAKLAATPGPTMAPAKQAQAMITRYDDPMVIPREVVAYPLGHPVPADLLAGKFDHNAGPCHNQTRCVVVFVDLNGDGVEDVIMASHDRAQIYTQMDGQWTQLGSLNGFCPGDEAALASGGFKTEPSTLKDLVIGGRRLQNSQYWPIDCPKPAAKPGQRVVIREVLDTELVRPPPPPVTSASAPPASPKPPAAKPPAGH